VYLPGILADAIGLALCFLALASLLPPQVNHLPRFSPHLISLERYTLSVYRAGEIDLFENLDIVHIRLLVVVDGL